MASIWSLSGRSDNAPTSNMATEASLVRVPYSVMQSDGNSFCANVVLNSFNKASRDENKISDQIYKSKYVRTIFW